MTAALLSKYDPIKGCFVLKDPNPLPPANAFEWQRFTDEERIRRGELPPSSNTEHKRRVTATKLVERKRVDDPTYGTIGISSKTEAMIAMKPRTFTVYSKAKGKK